MDGGRDWARALVRRIARSLGRGSGPATLLRSGANEVYAIDDLVIRLARTDLDVDRHAAIATFLLDHGVPVPEPVAAGEADGIPYSVWERIRPDSSLVDFGRFGAGIRALHEIEPHDLDGHQLPWCDEAGWLDLARVLDLAAAARVVTDDDLALLAARVDQLRSWGDRCRGADRPVVCHGDAHPQNVLMRAGRAVIVDWDTICVGPPQWDHAALLTWPDRWGGGPEDYRGFAAGYGRSFEHDPLARQLAEVRLLAATINLIARASGDRRATAEARLRVRFWRHGADAPPWTPR